MAGLYFSVGADFSKLNRLKRDIDNLKAKLKGMDQAANPREFARLEKQLKQLSIEFDREAIAAQRAGLATRRAGQDAGSAASDFDKLKRASLMVGGTTGLLALGKEVVNVRGEIESMEKSFDVLLGGKDKADALIASMKEITLKSNYSLTDLAGGAQTLLGFNVDEKQIIPVLEQIGNIAMGNKDRFNSLTLAFAQMSATGKLMGQDLLQMINAGFNPLQVIAEKTGKTIIQVKEDMSNGAISAEMIAEAYRSAATEGGKFAGMMESQADGIRGAEAVLSGVIQDVQNELGQSNEDLIKGGYKVTASFVKNYKTVGEVLTGFIATYGLYKTAIITTNAIKPVQMAQTYEAQAVALSKLLTGEQAHKISQLGLVQGSAEHVAAIQTEIAATAESLQSKLAEEKINLQSLRTKRAEAEQTWMLAKVKTQAAKEELASAIATAQAEAEASLKKKMAIESEKQSRSALRVIKLQEQKDAAISQATALKEKQVSAEKIAAKNREIASIQAKIVAAREEEIQHGRNVAVMRAEIKAGVNYSANKNVQTLSNKVNTLSEKENAAATAHNGYIKQMVGSKTLIKKLATQADTAMTVQNTAVTVANTTATNVLTAAKTRLWGATKNLFSVLVPNPYILAAAAVVGLVYGIYKGITATTEWEDALKRINNTTKEYEKSIASERAEIDILFGKLKAAKEGTEEYEKAKDAISSKYGHYLKDLSDEVVSLSNVSAAYDAITKAAIQAAKARAIESGTKDATESFGKSWGENIEKIQQAYTKKYGELRGTKIFTRLREQLEKGLDISQMTEEVKASFSHWDDTIFNEGSGDSRTVNFVKNRIKDIQDSRSVLEKEVSELNTLYGEILQVEPESSSTPTVTSTIKDEINKATVKVKSLKKELKDLRSGNKESTDYSGDIEKKAKELEDAEKKLATLTGRDKKSISAGESAAEKDLKSSQKQIDDQLKLINDKAKIYLDTQTFELENQERLLDIQEDGFDKQQKLIELNHQKELLSIQKRAQELIEKRQDEERKQWELNNPNTQKTFTTSIKTILDLSPEDQAGLIQSDTLSNKLREKETDDLLKSILDKYQDFDTRRRKIEEDYQKTVRFLSEQRAKAQTDIEIEENYRAVREATKQRNDAIKSVNNEEAEELHKTSDLFVRLFTDASKQSVDQIKKVIDETQALYDLLSSGKEITNQDAQEFGFTAEQLNTFKGDAEKMKAILDGLIAKKKELAGKSEFQAFSQSIGDAIGKIKLGGAENIGAGISDIGNAVNQITPTIKKFGEDLGTIFNDEKIGEDIGLITDGIAGLGTTAAGVGQLISGDIMGGIQNTVSGLASVVTVFGKLKDRKKEKEIQRLQVQVEALDKAYEKLGRSIDKAYSKDASELIDKQNKALEQQKLLIQQQIKEEEDKKKTDEGRISDWKNQIEEIDKLIEDNKEKAVDAIFGEDIKSAIDEFAQAYVDAWAAGEDRAKAMKDIVKNMIKGVVVEMLKSDLAPTVEKIRNKIQEYLTDGIIDSTEQSELDRITEEVTKNADNKYGWADKYLQGDKDSSSYTQSSSKGGFETMNQDQAGEMNGRLTGILETELRTEENTLTISTDVKAMLGQTFQISESVKQQLAVQEEIRNIQINSYYELKDINKNTKELYQINERLGGIERNTKGLLK